MFVCFCDNSIYDIAQGIDNNMSFPAFDLLTVIIAACFFSGAFASFYTLTIHSYTRRLNLSSFCNSYKFIENRLDFLQMAVFTHVAEMAIYRLPRRKILRQVSPFAAVFQKIKNSVENTTHIHFAPTASFPFTRKVPSNKNPLILRQI
ncbi:hypothetical protein AD945_01135 [Gluconobacter albidus]|uniref:Uncharacterized protein n=1 Tax=Gluconobacter albidus TaxID=318683 RepID=A0A149TN54_9PROT|nr:hypothetical protein AD945_01135 [Gluconobacter albidus]